jgi:hypothetical protein
MICHFRQEVKAQNAMRKDMLTSEAQSSSRVA